MTIFERPLRTNQLTCYEENGALSLLNKVFDAFQDTGRELNLEPFVLIETVQVDEDMQRAVVSIATKDYVVCYIRKWQMLIFCTCDR